MALFETVLGKFSPESTLKDNGDFVGESSKKNAGPFSFPERIRERGI